MTTTLEKTLSAFYLLNSLNSVRMKSTATSRKLFSLKALTKPAFEFYQEEEKKIIEDLGGTIAEDSTIIFSENQDENFKKLAEGLSELRKSEWEIPIDKPVIFHDAEGVQVSGNDIEILQGLAEFLE
jgi:hypothetical protein